MIAFIRQNLRTMLMAFFLALVVWLSAVNAEDPPLEDTITSLPISFIGQDAGLLITSQSATTASITLRAPRSIWENTILQPEAIEAWVDLTGLQAGTYTLPVQMIVKARPVRILKYTPETVTITLEKVTSRKLPLHIALIGEPAVGYEIGDATADPHIITITGPESAVAQVVRVQARINIAGSRESIDQTISIQALDSNSLPVSGVTLIPDQVHITLPVTLRGGYRDVAVKVNVRGAPAGGYRLTSISVYPPIVTVFSSDPNLVASLPSYVETQPIDLQNLTDTLETRLALNLPEGVSLVGDQTVRVVVQIEPLEGSLTIPNLPVEIVNPPEDLQVTLSPETITVILTGPLPQLDKFRTADIRLFVDLLDLGEGTYQVPVQVELPNAELKAESLLPGTVEVTISPPNATP